MSLENSTKSHFQSKTVLGVGVKAEEFCSPHDYDPLVQDLMVLPQSTQTAHGEPENIGEK